MKNNDIWLTQNLIAELFGVGRSTITEHINNILNSGELKDNPFLILIINSAKITIFL